jgi:hypothetical protein
MPPHGKPDGRKLHLSRCGAIGGFTSYAQLGAPTKIGSKT